MEIKDRIKLIMDNENMLSGAFAESIGVQQSTLSHILNGRNKPSLDVVIKVHQHYSYINLEWLLYGIGEMKGNSGTSLPLNDSFLPSLFDQNPENVKDEPDISKKRQEIEAETPEKPTKETVIQEIKYIERPQKKITEIRIFFDDNTYETFKSEKIIEKIYSVVYLVYLCIPNNKNLFYTIIYHEKIYSGPYGQGEYNIK